MSILGSSKGPKKEVDLYKNAMMKNAMRDDISMDSYRSLQS